MENSHILRIVVVLVGLAFSLPALLSASVSIPAEGDIIVADSPGGPPPASCILWDPPPGDPIPIEYQDDAGGDSGTGACKSCATFISLWGVRSIVCCNEPNHCATLRIDGWSIQPLNHRGCRTRHAGGQLWCEAYGSYCTP